MTDRRIQHAHTAAFFKSFEAKKITMGKIAMDSGCGDGYASRVFATYGARLILAHDIVLNFDERYNHPRIKQYDSLKMIHDICDIVWSHHVIEHIPNPIDYLRQMRNRLGPTGELWLACPNTAHTPVFADGHLHNFTIANLVLCLRNAGFPIKYIRWQISTGQLRIRVPRNGASPSLYPEPFRLAMAKNLHFNVTKDIPQVWRWNNEE